MEYESTARQQGYASEPLVSVLVVVFRAAIELPPLLESIFEHKSDDIELIVIDGGSDDGTVEYLRSHRDRIDYCLSEPDHGIYDAMNKAVAKARGTFLLHLNAGDRLLTIPRDELHKAKQDHLDVAAFRVSIDNRHQFKPSAGWSLRFTNTLHHQGTFYRRQAFLSYDLRFKVFADFDMNQRLALAGARIQTYDRIVALHLNNGLSNEDSGRVHTEFFSVIEKNHGRAVLPFARLVRKWQGLKIMLGMH